MRNPLFLKQEGASVISRKVLFVATVVKEHIEAFHLPYLKWFREHGYETHVAAADNGSGAEIPYCDVFHPIPFDRRPLSPRNIKAYRRLRRVIDSEHFELIHCHTPVGGVLARLAARESRKRGMKLLYTAHGFAFYKGAPPFPSVIFKAVEKYCAKLTDVLITINREDFAYAKHHLHAGRIEYVPGVGVDTEAYAPNALLREKTRKSLGLSDSETMVLSVGRLDRNKNHETAIRAAADCIRKHPETAIRLFIAGDGRLRRRLETLARALGMESHVCFLGYRADIPALMCAADIYIHLSKTEGLPRAVMEAMACGLPVVASDARGCRYLLHGAQASLFHPSDYCAVGAALATLTENPERRKKLGAENRERIRPFSLDNTLAKMDGIYRSAMEKQVRVLHVLGSSKFYGAEHVVCDIIERFRGNKDIEMAYASPDGEIAEALRAREIRFIPMKKLTPFTLKKAISAYRPDILHAHDVRAGVVCASFSGTCKIVSTMHVNTPAMRRKTPKARLYRMAARRFSHIFWVNRSAMEEFAFADAVADKSEHLANIIDIAAVRGRAGSIPVPHPYAGVYLGRFEEQKDPMRLMRIFAGILKRCPDVRFAAAGSGSMLAETVAYAKALGISEHVDFPGYLENPYTLLAGARFLLMCSKFEGLPIAALEAGALGVPVVAVKTDGLAEAVEDGQSGFLSDDDGTLIRHAAALISDDALYGTMHAAAYRHSEEINDGDAYKNKLRRTYFS